MTDTITLFVIVIIIMLAASGITVLTLSAFQKWWDNRKGK